MLRKAISLITISLVLSSCGKKNDPVEVDRYAQFIAHSQLKMVKGREGEVAASICTSALYDYDQDLYLLYMADLTLDAEFNFFNATFYQGKESYCLLSNFLMERTSDSDYSARSECSILGQKFNTSCSNQR